MYCSTAFEIVKRKQMEKHDSVSKSQKWNFHHSTFVLCNKNVCFNIGWFYGSVIDKRFSTTITFTFYKQINFSTSFLLLSFSLLCTLFLLAWDRKKINWHLAILLRKHSISWSEIKLLYTGKIVTYAFDRLKTHVKCTYSPMDEKLMFFFNVRFTDRFYLIKTDVLRYYMVLKKRT